MLQAVDNVSIETQTISSSDNLIKEEEFSLPQRVYNFAAKFFQSPMVWFFAGLSVTFIAFTAVNLTSIGCIFVGLYIGHMICFPSRIPKSLCYELAILYNLTRGFFSQLSNGRNCYYHKILPGIYLGALPLKSHGHDQLISEKLGAKSVLSILETFEIDTDTFFSTPVRTQDWENLNINHKQIDVEDHTRLTFNQLDEAADFIHENQEDGIYIHCKSGMGRGPSALIAYLIKYQDKTLDEILNFIKNIRNIHVNEDQRASLKQFERLVKI